MSIDAVTQGVFATWLVLTVLCQTRSRFSSTVRHWDLVALVPLWTFFSPNPLQQNVNLFYRTISDNGDTSGWKPILPRETMGLRRLGFNPHRRARKALIDLVIQFVQEKDDYASTDAMKISIPYIAMLLEAVTAAQEPNARSVQFCVLATRDDLPIDSLDDALILLSDGHPV